MDRICMVEGNTDIVYRILEGVAESEGVEIMPLPQLGDAVEVNALQTLLDSGKDIRVEFEYVGHDGKVTNRTVLIDEAESG